MKTNKDYKTCPYCELNLIPLTECCCDVCYASKPVARQEADAQRRLRYEKMEEPEAKDELLNIWGKLGFMGFLHTTNFDNFIKIYKSEFLKSRNQLTAEGISFEDNAEFGVLENTQDIIKTKVRFYYRPITPTNISAFYNHNQTNPVLMAFDKGLIFNEDVMFCNGCAGNGSTKIVKTAKEALMFNWKEIFDKGPYDSWDNIAKNYRNAEFLVNSPISIEKAIKFYFQNEADFNKACELLGQDVRFEYNPELFFGGKL